MGADRNDDAPRSEPAAPSDSGSDQPDNPPGPDWLYRIRQRWIGDSALRRLVWRLVVTALGGAIVLSGLAMLVLPGPGWAVIFLGLAVLATEYAWAHRLLVVSKEKAQGAASSAFSPENRTRTFALLVIVAMLLASVISWYVYHYGWTFNGPRTWF